MKSTQHIAAAATSFFGLEDRFSRELAGQLMRRPRIYLIVGSSEQGITELLDFLPSAISAGNPVREIGPEITEADLAEILKGHHPVVSVTQGTGQRIREAWTMFADLVRKGTPVVVAERGWPEDIQATLMMLLPDDILQDAIILTVRDAGDRRGYRTSLTRPMIPARP